MSGFYSLKGERILVRVKIRPRAKANTFVGIVSDELVVKIKAPPHKGQANRELIAFLSEEMGIARSLIRLESGAASPHKQVSLPASALPFLRRIPGVS